jgi:hypothetical protein
MTFSKLDVHSSSTANCSLLPPKKRKGPQLALEPLNGRGIAGYVPKPEF